MKDSMIGFYELGEVDDFSWKLFGPEMKQAVWSYISFDPLEEKQDSGGNRYRAVWLPAGSKNWSAAEFAASKAGWKFGKSPFGQKDGKLISEATGGYYKGGGPVRGALVYNHLLPEFSSGRIMIAEKDFLRSNGHQGKVAPPSGHFGVWLEAAKLSPFTLKITDPLKEWFHSPGTATCQGACIACERPG